MILGIHISPNYFKCPNMDSAGEDLRSRLDDVVNLRKLYGSVVRYYPLKYLDDEICATLYTRNRDLAEYYVRVLANKTDMLLKDVLYLDISGAENDSEKRQIELSAAARVIEPIDFLFMLAGNDRRAESIHVKGDIEAIDPEPLEDWQPPAHIETTLHISGGIKDYSEAVSWDAKAKHILSALDFNLLLKLLGEIEPQFEIPIGVSWTFGEDLLMGLGKCATLSIRNLIEGTANLLKDDQKNRFKVMVSHRGNKTGTQHSYGEWKAWERHYGDWRMLFWRRSGDKPGATRFHIATFFEKKKPEPPYDNMMSLPPG